MWAVQVPDPWVAEACWWSEASSVGAVGLLETEWGEERLISIPMQLGYSIHKHLQFLGGDSFING